MKNKLHSQKIMSANNSARDMKFDSLNGEENGVHNSIDFMEISEIFTM